MKQKQFIAGKSYVSTSGQEISDSDKLHLHSVVDSGWYTDGRKCTEFRDILGKINAKKHVMLTNSGSSASLVAMSAMTERVHRPFKYILTCATGFPTTVAPIYQTGHVPIYVDINPENLQPDRNQTFDMKLKYAGDIGFVVMAHTLGFPFYEAYFADSLPLVSDGCDALGSKINDKPVGYKADISTLSFFPAHHITTGQGGAVLTDDAELQKICDSYIHWGRDCFCEPGQNNTCGKRFDNTDGTDLPLGWDHKYRFERLGYNLQMTEFQAALGVSQAMILDEFTKKRQEHYAKLLNGLFVFNEYISFVSVPEWSKPSPFGFPILVRDTAPFSAMELIEYLELNKVGTRRVFGGNLTRQPAFKNLYHIRAGDLSGSDKVMNDMLWIGCHPALTNEMLDYVISTFDAFFKSKGL